MYTVWGEQALEIAMSASKSPFAKLSICPSGKQRQTYILKLSDHKISIWQISLSFKSQI